MNTQDSMQPISTSAMAIAGFVIGLVALLTSFMPIINNFSFFLGVLAIVFSIVGLVGCVRGKKKGKGLAIAALVISIISCVVVLWSQSVYVNAINEATSTTKAALSTTKASTNSQSSENTSVATDSQFSSAASEKNTTSGEEATDGNTSADGDTEDLSQYAYQVSIEGLTLGETYDGQSCAVVTYSFTNNSDEETSFMVAINAKAYQNGVELETGIISDIDSNASKRIKPGGTVTVQKAYVLDDQSDVTIECTELFAFDGVILAEATFPVA